MQWSIAPAVLPVRAGEPTIRRAPVRCRYGPRRRQIASRRSARVKARADYKRRAEYKRIKEEELHIVVAPTPTRIIFDSLEVEHVAFLNHNFFKFYEHLWNGTVALGVKLMTCSLERAFPKIAAHNAAVDGPLCTRFTSSAET
ncbi:hypothetical protein MPER_03598, partial [Moniliophthora perniciosa FA553]